MTKFVFKQNSIIGNEATEGGLRDAANNMLKHAKAVIEDKSVSDICNCELASIMSDANATKNLVCPDQLGFLGLRLRGLGFETSEL